MKKLVLIAALAFASYGASAQTGQFKIGANVGLPVGDAADISSFTAGVDLAYQWSLAEGFHLGVATGFQNYFAKSEYKDAGFSDANYVPVAASAQYSLSPQFFIGADLGYGFLTGKESDGGGFYYQPKVGYQGAGWEGYLGYKGLSDEGTLSSVNLGVNFKF